jgi:transcriptional regulator with XRE-family HTH domain
LQPTGEWLTQPGGLADRLHGIRKAAGMTGDELARHLGWTRSKVPKIENGRQMPTADDIRAWAEACGRPGDAGELLDLLAQAQAIHRQYRHALRRGHAALQVDLDQLVRQAKRVRNVEILVIPGLLQTVDYARCRMLEAVNVYGASEDGVEAALAARMRRQEVLYDSSRQFEFAITEAALRIQLCPRPVMLGQIDRLANLSRLPNITFGIIPFGTELPVTPIHGFLLLDDMAYIETHASEILLTGEEGAAYPPIADRLMAEAVTGDKARQLLERYNRPVNASQGQPT